MIPMTHPPVAFSSTWRSLVANGTREGLGSEDLAIRLGCRREAVSREVATLRATGKLDCPEWWGRK